MFRRKLSYWMDVVVVVLEVEEVRNRKIINPLINLLIYKIQRKMKKQRIWTIYLKQIIEIL